MLIFGLVRVRGLGDQESLPDRTVSQGNRVQVYEPKMSARAVRMTRT